MYLHMQIHIDTYIHVGMYICAYSWIMGGKAHTLYALSLDHSVSHTHTHTWTPAWKNAYGRPTTPAPSTILTVRTTDVIKLCPSSSRASSCCACTYACVHVWVNVWMQACLSILCSYSCSACAQAQCLCVFLSVCWAVGLSIGLTTLCCLPFLSESSGLISPLASYWQSGHQMAKRPWCWERCTMSPVGKTWGRKNQKTLARQIHAYRQFKSRQAGYKEIWTLWRTRHGTWWRMPWMFPLCYCASYWHTRRPARHMVANAMYTTPCACKKCVLPRHQSLPLHRVFVDTLLLRVGLVCRRMTLARVSVQAQSVIGGRGLKWLWVKIAVLGRHHQLLWWRGVVEG